MSTSFMSRAAAGVFVLMGTVFCVLAYSSEAQTLRQMTFPVAGPVVFNDDFGDPRSGHLHEGNDLMGKKMQPLLAAVDGVVTFVAFPQRTWGYSVTIRDTEGYQYRYLHMNNDTPGTDDGRGGPMHAYAPNISPGNRVVRGQLIGWMGDSGNAEGTSPHLHFEMRMPDGTAFSPYVSLRSAAKLLTPVPAPILENETLPYGNLGLDVSVAAGNFDSDSATEFVTGPGKGGGPHVRTFDSADGSAFVPASFYAYFADFYGGIDVAAGDTDGDGIDEIITGAGPGGGPHVRVFKANGTPVGGGFFAYDAGFTGGVRVAAADLDGDGIDEIITGAGPGGGPHVRVFKANGTSMAGFLAFEPGFVGGVDVAAAPAAGNAPAAIIVGQGAGDRPRVRIFNANGGMLREFFAYDEAFTGGVRVSAGNVREGSVAHEIAVAPERFGGPHFKIFSQDGSMLDDTRMFDEWWIGSYDVAAGRGIAYAASGGAGLAGPSHRASIRELSFRETTYRDRRDRRWSDRWFRDE